MEAWLKLICKGLCFAGLALTLIYRGCGSAGPVWGIVLVFAAAVACNLLAEHVRREKNKENPITEAEAVFMSRRTERHGRYGRKYFLKFMMKKDHTQLEFEVPYSEFDVYTMGDTGVLRYRTWEYLSFSRGRVLTEQTALPVESGQIEMYDLQADAPVKDDGILLHELDE